MDSKKANRDSNMELLRVLCMFFILVHHFIVHVLYPDLTAQDGVLNGYRIACVFLNGFVYVGVNCFILISGFYGIKFKVKSLFKLYCICVFYSLLLVLIQFGFGGVQLDKALFYRVFFPFSHPQWWFMTCYVVLFMLAPVLNKAIQYLNRKEFVLVLVLLTVVNVYLGFYWHQYNVDGYNVEQFVYIYFIGAYLRRFPIKALDRKKPLLLYVGCAMVWSVMTLVSIRWHVPHWNAFFYNSPFVVLAAVGLFVYMKNKAFYNAKINAIAASVLPAYLLQDADSSLVYSWTDRHVLPLINGRKNELAKTVLMLLFVFLASVALIVVAFIIDQIRLLLMRPVWKVYGVASAKVKTVSYCGK